MRQLTALIIYFLSLSTHAQITLFSYDASGNLARKTVTGQSLKVELSGQETLCEGDTLIWMASGGDFDQYTWNTGLKGAILKIVPANSGTYSVTATSKDGCESAVSKSFVLRPKPVLQGIRETSAPGVSGLATYATTELPGMNYAWTISNGRIVSGQGTSSVQVQWIGERELGQLQVYAISGAGCRSDLFSLSGGGLSNQRIPLSPGWNLVSTYLDPLQDGVSDVFKDLIQSRNLERVKDIDKVFNPDLPVGNSLLNIEPGAGYWVSMKANSIWEVKGYKLNPESTPIQLKKGWNLIGYLPYQALPPADALASVLPKVKLVKNVFASFDPMVPPIFNTLSIMQPGQGYWVEMNEPATLFYPKDLLEKSNSQFKITWDEQELVRIIKPYSNSTSAYGEVTFNGKPIPERRLIVAMVGNETRGAGYTFLHNSKSYVTLVVNSSEAETVRFYLEDEGESHLSRFQLKSEPGKTIQDYLPLEFGSYGLDFNTFIFPNPSQGVCRVRMTMTEQTALSLYLLDITGKKLRTLLEPRLHSKGTYEFEFDLTSFQLSGGVYFINALTDGHSSTHKLIFIKNP